MMTFNNSPTPKNKQKSISFHSVSNKSIQKRHLVPPPSSFHSASSLQHSVLSISFPKASRASPRNLFLDQIHSNVYLPSQTNNDYKSKRSTSFGFGQKQFLPPSVIKNARDIPASNNYNLPSLFQKLDRGKTFGLSRQCFEKTYVPGFDVLPLGVAKDLPGPGQYDIIFKRPKKNGFSIVGKGANFNKVVKEEGPFRAYELKMDFVEASRFKNIGFGVSQRGNFTDRKDKGPGPGTYDHIGIFDKYKKKY